MSEELEAKLRQIEADTQYFVGCFDALARLLGHMARAQGLDLEDALEEVSRLVAGLHPELEEHRINGYQSVLTLFSNSYEGRPN